MLQSCIIYTDRDTHKHTGTLAITILLQDKCLIERTIHKMYQNSIVDSLLVMARLIVTVALLPVVHSGYNKNLYMPGTSCSTIRIREIDGAVIRSSPNKLWSNSACLVKLEADDSIFTSKRLMINVEELNIDNCDVSLKIYFHRSSDGRTPDYAFTCNSAKPKMITTPGKYATFRLDTRTDRGFSFKVIVTSFKETSFCSEFRCANRRCIENKLRCDGINHCGDRSDETSCAGVRRPGRFGMGSTLASTFSSLVVVIICVALCVVCVRRRRRSQQGEVLQQHIAVHTGIEPGPPPPGMGQPGQGQYQQVSNGYQVPSYNPGAYPPQGPMPPGPGQPPPPYGYQPQPYYPPPMGPPQAYPPQGDVMYPPPGPMGPPMGAPMGPPMGGPMGPPMGPPMAMGMPPGQQGPYPVSYNASTEQVKMPGNP